ncbi:MAG: T9SS type A sorting domain-containing protein [Flavobacteriales bacterium]
MQLGLKNTSYSQCQNYTVFINIEPGCSTFNEITWQLLGSDGTLWLSGSAPFSQVICLPDDCYTLNMLDTGGDGWECVDWFIEDFLGDLSFDTNLNNGNFGTDTFELGLGDCAGGGGGGGCPVGTSLFNLQVDDGDFPNQISWQLTLSGVVVASGVANADMDLCLDDGCYAFEMFDTAGNGWNDAFYTLEDENGNPLYDDTMLSGDTAFVIFNIGGLDCTDVTPGGGGGSGGGGGGGGGGNPGAGCGSLAPSSDCATAPCACDTYSFPITPSGAGTFADVPGPGSVSNPAFGSSPPWGGTDFGCLLAGELNSSWMVFTIGTGGSLQFSFGQNSNGGQFGFYDWSMWAYNGVTTCSQISGNALPPVRCLWNATTVGGTGLANPVPAGGNAGNYGPPLTVTAGQQFIICLSNYSFVNANVVLDFFGTATIQCAAMLPVEFISIEANQLGKDVLVEWKTATEVNCDYFEVQRSDDGYNWSAIGTMHGHGTTYLEQHYAFLDEDPLHGFGYYRIKEIDFNGASNFSDAVDVYLKNLEISIYPNPSENFIQIRGAQNGIISMYSTSGQLVYSNTNVQDPIVQLETTGLANGAYAVCIQMGEQFSYHTIIVKHE